MGCINHEGAALVIGADLVPRVLASALRAHPCQRVGGDGAIGTRDREAGFGVGLALVEEVFGHLGAHV